MGPSEGAVGLSVQVEAKGLSEEAKGQSEDAKGPSVQEIKQKNK